MSVSENTQGLEELLGLVRELPEAGSSSGGENSYDAILELDRTSNAADINAWTLTSTKSDNPYDLVEKIRAGNQVKIAVKSARGFYSSSTGYIQGELLTALVIDNQLMIALNMTGDNDSIINNEIIQLGYTIDGTSIYPSVAFSSKNLSFETMITILGDYHPIEIIENDKGNIIYSGRDIYNTWFSLTCGRQSNVVVRFDTRLMSSGTRSPSCVIADTYTVDYDSVKCLVVSFRYGDYSPFNSLCTLVFLIDEENQSATLDELTYNEMQMKSDGIPCDAIIRLTSTSNYTNVSASDFTFASSEIYTLFNSKMTSNYNKAHVILRGYTSMDTSSTRYYSQVQAISIVKYYNNTLLMTFPITRYDGVIGLLELTFTVSSSTSVTLSSVNKKYFSFTS